MPRARSRTTSEKPDPSLYDGLRTSFSTPYIDATLPIGPGCGRHAEDGQSEVGVAIKRKAISLSVNGAEYLELDAKAREAGLTIPAYMRTRCGLEAWIARGREMQSRAQPASRLPLQALERLAVTITVTEAEHAQLETQATTAGLSIPQYIRSQCGFQVRWTSAPNTEERDREEDDAWDRLQRLGLNPQDYFPPEP
jgi:hypothetical protein